MGLCPAAENRGRFGQAPHAGVHVRYSGHRARTNRAGELLADILPERVVSGPPISATLGTYAADLHGLQEMMVSMMASPELMHRLMGHLRDAALAGMRAVEESGLLSANNTGPMTCSEPVGPHDGPVTYKNYGVMANSQEFDAVGRLCARVLPRVSGPSSSSIEMSAIDAARTRPIN